MVVYQITESVDAHTDICPLHAICAKQITLTTSGLLRVKKGYRFARASRIMPDVESVIKASLVYDALSYLVKMDLLSRSQVNKEFYRQLLAGGMNSLAAWICYCLLRGK